MLDFSALTLAPAMATFGRPVRVIPGPSRPPRAPFDAVGVWRVRNLEIAIEGGGALNDVTLTLGIRLADWPSAPQQFDRIEVPAAGGLPAEGTLWIDDIDPDGQGGVTLTLKHGAPPAR